MTSTGTDGLRGVAVAATTLSHIDGEAGRLTVCGYAIEDIAPRCSFEEAAFLLFERRLPAAAELARFSRALADARAVPWGVAEFGRQAAAGGIAPMDALMTLAASMRRPDRDLQPAEIVGGLMMAAGRYAGLRAGVESAAPPEEDSHVEVAAYEQYVYVPVDPNSADAETLMQLTGVDEAIAEALIEARPYASADAFLERLAASVELSDADIEQAGTMLTGFDE